MLLHTHALSHASTSASPLCGMMWPGPRVRESDGTKWFGLFSYQDHASKKVSLNPYLINSKFEIKVFFIYKTDIFIIRIKQTYIS